MKLLGQEKVGNRLEKWWMHSGPAGKKQITVETIEDVEPVFEGVKRRAQSSNTKDFKYVASIPATVIDEVCRINANLWGIRPNEVMAELVSGTTDRSQKVWRLLSQSRDYQKFQARNY